METPPTAEPRELPNSYPFDAIIVLGARMQRDPKKGIWEFPTIIQEDIGKVVGGHSRAIAAVQALKEHLAPVLLITGGIQKEADGSTTSRAEMLCQMIVNKYHAQNEQVVQIGNNGGNTLGNGEDLVTYLKGHLEMLKSHRIGILTNGFHEERALLLLQSNPFLQKTKLSFSSFQ